MLLEFYVQATRAKRRARLDHQAALAYMRTWRRYPVVAITEAVFESALSICAEFRLSYWDSAVIAAAALAGCGEVLSEDLPHGSTIAGVAIRNPFL